MKSVKFNMYNISYDPILPLGFDDGNTHSLAFYFHMVDAESCDFVPEHSLTYITYTSFFDPCKVKKFWGLMHEEGRPYPTKIQLSADAWGVRKLTSHALRNFRQDRQPRAPRLQGCIGCDEVNRIHIWECNQYIVM